MQSAIVANSERQISVELQIKSHFLRENIVEGKQSIVKRINY